MKVSDEEIAAFMADENVRMRNDVAKARMDSFFLDDYGDEPLSAWDAFHRNPYGIFDSVLKDPSLYSYLIRFFENPETRRLAAHIMSDGITHNPAYESDISSPPFKEGGEEEGYSAHDRPSFTKYSQIALDNNYFASSLALSMIEVRAVGNALYDFYSPSDDKIASMNLGIPADHVRAILAEGITDDGIVMEDIAHYYMERFGSEERNYRYLETVVKAPEVEAWLYSNSLLILALFMKLELEKLINATGDYYDFKKVARLLLGNEASKADIGNLADFIKTSLVSWHSLK